MRRGIRALSGLLVLLMLFSLCACGQSETVSVSAAYEPKQTVETEEVSTAMEDVATADLSARNPVRTSGEDDLSVSVESMETEELSAYLDEDNALTVPFDMAYPELFESGEIAYSDEIVMVKFSKPFNGKLSSRLQQAGLAKLELMFELEDAVWYKAYVAEGADVIETVSALRELKQVLVAEYDFTAEAAGGISDANALDSSVTSNPDATEQWSLLSCGIQQAWAYQQEENLAVAGKGTVVAVIDTGVDYDHVDLKSNMWVNTGEIPDNGVDDDGNGYIDDYYGVNIVDSCGNGDDDHGHGTHVAGIIAASNNKEGVVGVAYNAQIMAIKAGMASGYFNQDAIAKAIYYAYSNGADVINMSFGGTASSIAVQDALELAYTRCVLVAAAGNEGTYNEYYTGALPSYPAALGYVLGVMSVDSNGVESSFSNWDVVAYSGVEYEVYAPGEQILSTIPGDRYAAWSGTSMAAPFVAGIAAMLRSVYSDQNTYPTKYIYGQISSTSDLNATCYCLSCHGKHNLPCIVNAYTAFTVSPTPDVHEQDYRAFDTVGFAEKNNGDGVIDAGETVALGFMLKNRWGMSKNTKVTIDAISSGGIAEPYVTFATSIDGTYGSTATMDYGSIGTYSTGDCGKVMDEDLFVGWENPFYLKVSDKCPNDYIVSVNVTVECGNALDSKDTKVYKNSTIIELTVRRGTVVSDVISSDMTLTANDLWIIPNSTIIEKGATVTVEPGAIIQFWSDDPSDAYAEEYIAYLQVEGRLLMQGTAENPITVKPSELMAYYPVQIFASNGGYVSMEYCNVDNFYTNVRYSSANSINVAKNCEFTATYGSNTYCRYLDQGTVRSEYLYGGYISIKQAENCAFYKLTNARWGGNNGPYFCGNYDNCAFWDCCADFSQSNFEACVFYGNNNSWDRTEQNQWWEWNSATGESETGFYKNPSSYSTNNLLSEYISGQSGVSLSEKITNGDKVYVRVYSYAWRYSTPEVIEAFAESLGGQLLCLETKEEYDELFNVTKYEDEWGYQCLKYGAIYWWSGNIGLVRGEDGYYWISDGTPAGEYIDLRRSESSSYESSYAYHVYSYLGDDQFDLYFRTDTYCDEYILEFPLGTVITNDSLTSDWNEFLGERSSSKGFYENAILNRLCDDEVSGWLRVQAPEDSTHSKLPLGGNYWGTTNEKLIGLQIVDYNDYKIYADIDESGYLTEAPELYFPYVVDAGVMTQSLEEGEEGLWKEAATVGNEEVLFYAEFSRDMDTTQPLTFRFGSEYPYADYEVEGEWVSARRWEGQVKLSTAIENGTQYLSIGGGKADNGAKLYTDWARFTFEIDTTAAMSMSMQASATNEGVLLSWYQDDFDTLAGYNIYRATEETGYYQRVNTSLIPADTKEFLDTTIEPGQYYYYNFTVVQTDMTESEPSGRVSVRAYDSMPPNLYHSPVYNAYTGSHVVISATAYDNVSIQYARLYYRISGQTSWTQTDMTAVNDKYTAMIPAADVQSAYDAGKNLEYYLEVFDGESVTQRGTAEEPYTIAVKLAVDKNDLGDVDADGVISAKDALMILQGKTNRLNLTAEQFKRADVNQNEKLDVEDVLRVLRYASGKLTSVLG